MKVSLIAGVLALSIFGLAACTEEAKAEGLVDVKPFAGVEKELESDTNRVYFGGDTSMGALSVGTRVNLDDVAGGMDFRLGEVEIDTAYALGKATSVYMENDIGYSDADGFSRSETTVGVRFAF